MINRKELKARAKAQLGGGIFTSRWLTALLVCLVYSAVFGICSLPGSISGVMQNIQSISNGDITSKLAEQRGALCVLCSLAMFGGSPL